MAQETQRIIQESVPGKQVTLAHIIANPTKDLYKKIGLVVDKKGAIGILTITPSETSIIAANIAIECSASSLAFVDRFSGSLVITGDLSAVETAMLQIIFNLKNSLGFSTANITKS